MHSETASATGIDETGDAVYGETYLYNVSTSKVFIVAYELWRD